MARRMWEDVGSSPPALTVTAGEEGPGETLGLTQGSHAAQTELSGDSTGGHRGHQPALGLL